MVLPVISDGDRFAILLRPAYSPPFLSESEVSCAPSTAEYTPNSFVPSCQHTTSEQCIIKVSWKRTSKRERERETNSIPLIHPETCKRWIRGHENFCDNPSISSLEPRKIHLEYHTRWKIERSLQNFRRVKTPLKKNQAILNTLQILYILYPIYKRSDQEIAWSYERISKKIS